jgi:response regulator RpfG family c-di-GMP phosphodiesterase
MTDKILFVDDDTNILAAIQRQLKKRFTLDVAVGPEEGLEAVQNNSGYAVVVSDLRMPKMDGIQFLAKVREMSPDSVRMMLTGNADLKSAIDAVNEGNVYRFATKPCPPDVLEKLLRQGLHQYRLIKAEKELLEKTVTGSIKMMSDLLTLVNPVAFGRTSRIKHRVGIIAEKLTITDRWQFETAAMLCQIGLLTVPGYIFKKITDGIGLKDSEKAQYLKHPQVAAELIEHIPRLQDVARIIRYQEKHHDGSGVPEDEVSGDKIPLGARILKVVLDFDLLEMQGKSTAESLKILKSREGIYDPIVVGALEAIMGISSLYTSRALPLSDLRSEMVLEADILSENGQLLIAKGQELNDFIIQRLKTVARHTQIKEPLFVRCVSGKKPARN